MLADVQKADRTPQKQGIGSDLRRHSNSVENSEVAEKRDYHNEWSWCSRARSPIITETGDRSAPDRMFRSRGISDIESAVAKSVSERSFRKTVNFTSDFSGKQESIRREKA
jgi:hypothetical protein